MTLTAIFLQFFFAYTVTITDHFGPNYVFFIPKFLYYSSCSAVRIFSNFLQKSFLKFLCNFFIYFLRKITIKFFRNYFKNCQCRFSIFPLESFLKCSRELSIKNPYIHGHFLSKFQFVRSYWFEK